MILVLNLYMKLPFGKMDARNPDVKHLASIIGRTAGAVAYRLTNYASCDPILKARGISVVQSNNCALSTFFLTSSMRHPNHLLWYPFRTIA
jgi:hypothetical protein